MRAPPPAVPASEAFVAPPLQLHWQQRPYRHGGSPFSSTLLGTISVAPVASSGCSGACCCCRRHRRFCSTSCGHGASEANRLVGVGCGGPPVTTRRERQRRRHHRSPFLLASSSPAQAPTPAPTPVQAPTPVVDGRAAAESAEDAAPGSGETRSVAGGSAGRVAGGTLDSGAPEKPPQPIPGWGSTRPSRGTNAEDDRSSSSSSSSSSGGGGNSVKGGAEGRLRLKWGLDVDIPVPLALEELVKGPWDPQRDIWRRQLDMAAQVVQRSGGVVFMEQLAPVLNPREGPPEWYRESATGGGGRGAAGYGKNGATDGISIEAVGGEALVLRLLFELNGAPEVTDDGDILYVFPGFAAKGEACEGRAAAGEAPTLEAFEAEQRGGGGEEKGFTATPEVLQFEEVPGLLDVLPKMPDQGPKVVKDFFQRTALSGLALFLSTCLVLGQLIFRSWPAWLAAGPAYLAWVALDDSLRRSRGKSAKQRDVWRGHWADVCRGDGDPVWRKRVAARLRARKLRGDGN